MSIGVFYFTICIFWRNFSFSVSNFYVSVLHIISSVLTVILCFYILEEFLKVLRHCNHFNFIWGIYKLHTHVFVKYWFKESVLWTIVIRISFISYKHVGLKRWLKKYIFTLCAHPIYNESTYTYLIKYSTIVDMIHQRFWLHFLLQK